MIIRRYHSVPETVLFNFEEQVQLNVQATVGEKSEF